MTKKHHTRWMAVIWTLLILAACSIPGRDLPDVQVTGVDKVAHFGLFAVFGWLWMSAGIFSLNVRVAAVLAAGIGYAAFTEFYQGLLPWDRSPDPRDVLADTIGLVAALATYLVYHRVRARKPS